ncbi:MAG: sigma factor AlgU regulator MucB [Sideroxydans sp.]
MGALRFLSGALGVLLACAGQADPLRTDEDWLRTMAFAAHQTNYSGVFVYQSGPRVETSRITHWVDDEGEHEYLESLDGPKREVVRDNDKVWVIAGDKKIQSRKRRGHFSFPALLPEQISAVHENYRVLQGEEDRVAGHHAHAIIFEPRDHLRYVRKLWAHSENGLVLKAQVQDRQGIIIEQYAFTQLDISAAPNRKWPSGERPVAPVLQGEGLPSVAVSSTPSGWQVDALPAGFRKVVEMRRTMPGRAEPVIHMVYSDGLAGISVFIERAAAEPEFHGLSSQGAVHVYNRLSGAHLITVVGEVPPRTVIQVADSVRYAGQ